MNLGTLRTEVENHGFDDTTYGTRITQYINDGYNLICRRVDYYIDEAADDVTTTTGQSLIPFPSDMARLRSVRDTDRDVELRAVLLRELDRSNHTITGAPYAYALEGANVRIFPPTDNVYHLELRYWKLPTALSVDSDAPNLPTDWHHLLWRYAVAQCYAADDDPQTAQYWMNDFNQFLAMFEADQKFINSDQTTQARSMWDRGDSLVPPGWSLYPYGY